MTAVFRYNDVKEYKSFKAFLKKLRKKGFLELSEESKTHIKKIVKEGYTVHYDTDPYMSEIYGVKAILYARDDLTLAEIVEQRAQDI